MVTQALQLLVNNSPSPCNDDLFLVSGNLYQVPNVFCVDLYHTRKSTCTSTYTCVQLYFSCRFRTFKKKSCIMSDDDASADKDQMDNRKRKSQADHTNNRGHKGARESDMGVSEDMRRGYDNDSDTSGGEDGASDRVGVSALLDPGSVSDMNVRGIPSQTHNHSQPLQYDMNVGSSVSVGVGRHHGDGSGLSASGNIVNVRDGPPTAISQSQNQSNTQALIKPLPDSHNMTFNHSQLLGMDRRVDPNQNQSLGGQVGATGLNHPDAELERLRIKAFSSLEDEEMDIENTPNVNELWNWIQHWFSVTGSRRVWKSTTDYGKTYYCKLGPKKKGRQYTSIVPVERQRVAIPVTGVQYDCQARVSVRFFENNRVKSISAPAGLGRHNHTIAQIDLVRMPQPIKDFIIDQKRLGLETLKVLKIARAKFPFVKIKSQDIRNAPIKPTDLSEDREMEDPSPTIPRLRATNNGQLALGAPDGSNQLTTATDIQAPQDEQIVEQFRKTVNRQLEADKESRRLQAERKRKDELIAQLQIDSQRQSDRIDRLVADHNKNQQRVLELEAQVLAERLRLEERVSILEARALRG
eukprot:CFRG5837T1